jgi:predicted transposase/invertase (TIGR01784 family)
MKYDITAKRLLEIGKESILKYFLSIDVESAEILEAIPTETVSIRSTDFPIRIKERSGEEYILLLEIQSNWRDSKVYDFIGYWARFKKKYKLPVKCAMLLLNKSGSAKDKFVLDGISFEFTLIKIWEFNPEDIIRSENVTLLPFIPLMNKGVKFVDKAVEKIYSSGIEKDIKSDFLTALAFFTGMRDENLAKELFIKRRDLMIESPVYDWIVEEGVEKGVEKGKLDDAKKMLKKGFSIEDISDITGLSTEKILELKK